MRRLVMTGCKALGNSSVAKSKAELGKFDCVLSPTHENHSNYVSVIQTVIYDRL